MWVTHSRFLFTEIAVCREKRHSLEKYINSIGTFILALSTHLTLGQYLLSLSLFPHFQSVNINNHPPKVVLIGESNEIIVKRLTRWYIVLVYDTYSISRTFHYLQSKWWDQFHLSLIFCDSGTGWWESRFCLSDK